MQNCITLLLIVLFSFPCFSQQKIGEINGLVRSNSELLSNATIQITATDRYALTDKKGNYKILKIPYGTYLVEVSFVGYEPILRNVVVNKPSTKADFLLESLNSLEEVIITAKSKQQKKREDPIKVEVIELKKIQERAVSITNIINQTAGVKIRQVSGVGSDYEVNINGLQTTAVRYFKNGIPTDYLGRAFQLNLIPTGNIDNIEIYKGMLPTNLGADALGGAINITTRNNNKNYLTTSYELGSFSTHSGTLNANYLIPKTKFNIGLNSYAIYSKNNYEIDAPVRDFETQKLNTQPLKRFNDGVNTQLVQANFGIQNSNFADVFNVEFSFFNYHKEIQNGYNLENVFGEVTEFETSKIVALSYKKTFLNKLFIDLFFAHANKNQKIKDVTDNTYDWYGNVINSLEPNLTRGEITSLKIDQSVDEIINTGRFYSKYKFSNFINLKCSTTFSSKEKVGTDPYSIPNPRTKIQPITLPSTYTKVISAIGLGLNILDNKIQNEFIVKSYTLNTHTVSLWRYQKDETQSHSSFGFGNALKYKFSKNSFLRISYEKATRIPTVQEYFGDNLFTVPNPQLIPEKSNNFNFGIHGNIDSDNRFFIDLNLFYRETDDFIRKKVIGLNLIHVNADTQLTKGVETSFSMKLKNSIKSKCSITYQDLRMINTANALEGSRTPNVPYFFTNFNISKQFNNLFKLPIFVDIYADYSFTEQYLLLSISRQLEPEIFQRNIGVNTLVIPEQHQFDIGLTARYKKLPVSFNFQVNNLLNFKLYDQFKIQKPPRNFRAKITYKF